MSITLYTPATGFPDLEIKIAYGLARVGIEAGYDISIIPEEGFYKIYYHTTDFDKGNQSFLTILKRLLSSDKFFDLGVKARYKGKYTANDRIFNDLSVINLPSLFDLKFQSCLEIRKDFFCSHTDISKFGGSSGLILISSFHAGKPYERDKRAVTFNQSLCAVCGYLAMLGLYSFGFNIQMGTGKNRKYCIVVPMPESEIKGNELQMLLALQKTLHNFWLSDVQPLKTFTIGLISKVPSLSDIIGELKLYFHLSLLSKDANGDTVVEQTALINTIPFSKFISNSAFNSATVSKLLGGFKNLPKVSSLLEITEILEQGNKNNLPKFARLYVQDTSTNKWVNLLYPETAKYLLKEVAMISPEIIESTALGSLARTLRYFIREKKYGYADDIRNARKESRDFEETITKMLREGRLRLEQKEIIHLPTDEEIKEVFRLANNDFESTKLALVMLAFSFPSSKEETVESIGEVQSGNDNNQ
jgi:CRISPR type I-A-associated protein Csa5